jgi:hypothetical protein
MTRAGDTARTEQAIRFGVQLLNGLPICSWRIWTHRDETCLAARNFARAWKVSLHSSGTWRIADIARTLTATSSPRQR